MSSDSTLYISKCKEYISFMFSQQQWSGLTQAELSQWMQNFRTLSPHEMEKVYKLLVHIIYFSEKDLECVLREGVYNCVAYKAVLEKQLNSNFETSSRALTTTYEDELKKTCFVPLLDSHSPHESGNFISRLLVQQRVIDQTQSMFIEDAAEAIRYGAFSRLVIVDDCVGSGQQLETFWTCQPIMDGGSPISISTFCKKYNVSANYITLFGYNQNISKLKSDFADLNIFCVRCLSDEHRVFTDNSYVWDDEAELTEALDLFSDLCRNAGIPLRGYCDLDFAFIMHNTIPDWTLPMFWKRNTDWNLLMRRKNSDD